MMALQPHLPSVSSCFAYHLKLGIADVTDFLYDSGVFIKAGSLSSIIPVQVTSLGADTASTVAPYCTRGCAPGMFIFHKGNISTADTINYTISGSATNGIDYTTIPNSIIIPAHDSTDTLYIYGSLSGSGSKIVILTINTTSSTCSGTTSTSDSAMLTINDNFPVHINTPDTTICFGESVLISTSGSPLLSYSWSPSASLNNSTLQDPLATPTVATTYTLTAYNSVCG
jgi:hypothetical protein